MKNNNALNTFNWIIVLSLLSVVVYHSWVLMERSKEPAILEETGSAYYPANTQNLIQYDLKSYDHGCSWFAYTNDAQQLPHLVGNASDKYPGLIEQVQAVKRLIDWNNAHGPLNFKDPQVQELLVEAGHGPNRKSKSE